MMSDITPKIINPGLNDYHCHSVKLSDGFDTSISYLVEQAGRMGMTELAITDHSEAVLRKTNWSVKGRKWLNRWSNTINKVQVIFGLEGDLLDETGEICDYTIDKFSQERIYSDFLILSAHNRYYIGDPAQITKAYQEAIKEHHQKIKCLGHPDVKDFAEYLDMKALIQAANDYGIPMEVDCVNLRKGISVRDNLLMMLETADQLYVNSDAHTRYEFETVRKEGFETLAELGFMIRRTQQLELEF